MRAPLSQFTPFQVGVAASRGENVATGLLSRETFDAAVLEGVGRSFTSLYLGCECRMETQSPRGLPSEAFAKLSMWVPVCSRVAKPRGMGSEGVTFIGGTR